MCRLTIKLNNPFYYDVIPSPPPAKRVITVTIGSAQGNVVRMSKRGKWGKKALSEIRKLRRSRRDDR